MPPYYLIGAAPMRPRDKFGASFSFIVAATSVLTASILLILSQLQHWSCPVSDLSFRVATPLPDTALPFVDIIIPYSTGTNHHHISPTFAREAKEACKRQASTKQASVARCCQKFNSPSSDVVAWWVQMMRVLSSKTGAYTAFKSMYHTFVILTSYPGWLRLILAGFGIWKIEVYLATLWNAIHKERLSSVRSNETLLEILRTTTRTFWLDESSFSFSKDFNPDRMKGWYVQQV